MSNVQEVMFTGIGLALGFSGWMVIYNVLGAPTRRNLVALGCWVIALVLVLVIPTN